MLDAPKSVRALRETRIGSLHLTLTKLTDLIGANYYCLYT